jgi:hypothetical protein
MPMITIERTKQMPIHPHQHAVKVVSSARSLDKAVEAALQGLTDPEGHHGHLALSTFEVTKIGGHFESDGSPVVEVSVEALAAHRE